MKYINKYADLAAYTADANRPAKAKTVSKIVNDLKYDGKNIVAPLSFSGKGDIIIYDKDDFTRKVVKLDTLDLATLPSNLVIGGVIAFRDEKQVFVVAQSNTTTAQKWAAPYQVKMSGFSLDTAGSFTITINSLTTATINYTTSDTLATLAASMQTAIRAIMTTHPAGWTVTAYAGYIFVQQDSYTPNVTKFLCSDANVTIDVLTGNYQTALTEFLTPYGFVRRNDGSQTYLAGANLERFIEYYSVSGSADTSQAVGASTIIKESYFNSTDNPLLVSYYGTYRNYMKDKMLRFPFSKGAIIDTNGKKNTDLLSAVSYTDRNGDVQAAYPAAYAAKNYGIATAGHTTGFEAGNWYLLSVREMYLLMKDITYGLAGVAGAASDAINRSLYAIGGTLIPVNASHWISAEYSSHNSWYYYRYGNLNNNSKYGALYVRPVSAFQI